MEALRSVDIRSLVILAVSLFLLFKAKAHPILVITVSGALAIVGYMVLPLIIPALA